uniref:Si:dkey-48p11.3 n=1 Tax=Cyprinus carpio TaxID=7962 RepID=A0A8C2GKC3_CYPCA
MLCYVMLCYVMLCYVMLCVINSTALFSCRPARTSKPIEGANSGSTIQHGSYYVVQKHMWTQVNLSCTCEELTMAQTQNSTKKASSRDLLTCGNGKGIHEKLLLNSKSASLQTARVPRSSVLDRLQGFLPQMAQANESLRRQMDEAPAGFFDIESVEDAEKVIEMDVALVELEDSDSSEEDESSSSSSSSSSEEDSSEEEVQTVTAKTLKLPGDGKRKANIQVLEKKGE